MYEETSDIQVQKVTFSQRASVNPAASVNWVKLSDWIRALLIEGRVRIKKSRVRGRWRMEMERGGLCESIIVVSPLLPGAQRRCGGPSPRRHSMVWHALHFSPLTVSSWTSSYANTWATGGFSYLVVGQEYLIIFKKTVRHIIQCLPKYDTFLFSPQHFPLCILGGSTCRWKVTDTQWCNLEKSLADSR